jgi:CelD/BcsL family acetyltransferase involved in cellulose biosynthesis
LPGYCVKSCVIEQPEDIEQEWLDLQNRVDCSWFQSWGWIRTWLEKIAIDYHPLVARVWFEGTLVGMGIFVHRRISRRLIIHTDALFLNEYPFDGRNMVIEYNGLLADPSHQLAVYRETIAHLFHAHSNCNELFFGALRSTSPLIHVAGQIKGVRLKILEESSTWSIDLDGFEQGIDAYLATLSKNRRTQIRRSFRLYEEHGPLQIDEASNAEAAQVFFDGLKELHTDRWKSKGLQGSFANPLWGVFNRALIRSRFASGEIQLLRVSNSRGVIGYLYNFVWRKHIYCIQGGFKFSENKQLTPGYVVHVLAIAYNKQKGMKVYDLMHGDSLYKTTLCNRNQTLQWMVMQRRRVRFSLEDIAVSIVRQYRRI